MSGRYSVQNVREDDHGFGCELVRNGRVVATVSGNEAGASFAWRDDREELLLDSYLALLSPRFAPRDAKSQPMTPHRFVGALIREATRGGR